MHYIIYFDIAAVILTSILILIASLRRAYETRLSVFYKILLWINLIACATDIVSCYFIEHPSPSTLFLTYAVNSVFLISHNATAILFLLYVLQLFRDNFGNRAERIFWISISVFEAALILPSYFTHLVFYIDDQGNYMHGPMMPALYVASFLIMIYTLTLFLRKWHQLSTFQAVTNVTFLSLLMGAVIFQYFFPAFLIEGYFAAVAFLMLNTVIDNPAAYFYRNTYCYNKMAFDLTVKEKFRKKESFTVLGCLPMDLTVLRKKVGDEEYKRLLRQAIKTCHRTFGQKNVYLIKEDILVVVLPERANPDEVIRGMDEKVGREFVLAEEMSIRLALHYCVLENPGYADSVSDVSDAIETMLLDVYQKTGKRVIYYENSFIESKHRGKQIVHLLHRAIRNDGFLVFFQPIWDNKTGKFSSAEALVRLKQGAEGFIGPDEFIPVAEKSGLILDIGEIVLDRVCRFLKDRKPEQYGLEYIEVNLSMLQLVNLSTVERLDAICKSYGVAPSQINFEITETANATEAQKITIGECIEYLHKQGYSFSLDDYGSGYSTLTYLADIPFRMVKLDKMILWKAMDDPDFRAVLAGTVRMMHDLGKYCIAEGVETDEMTGLLHRLGCDYSQGYYYSRPVAEDIFLTFLKKHEKNLSLPIDND